jgi:Big-like domain-containing protein
VRRKLILAGAVMLAAVTSVAGAMTATAGQIDGPRPINLPPRVALTSPTDGSGGVFGCPFTFAAVALDPDDEILWGPPATSDDWTASEAGIDRVEFHLNGQLLATDDTAPYEVTVRNGPFVHRFEGVNIAFARAFDRDTPQLSADSATVSFFMVDPPPSLPDIDPCMQATPPPIPAPPA